MQPADWIMNIAQSVDFKQLEADGFFPEDRRDIGAAFDSSDSSTGRDALGITTHSIDETVDTRPVGFVTQLRLLFLREVMNFKRDTTSLVSKFGLTIFLAILIGIIFLDVGATDNDAQLNIQSRFGALIMCLMIGMFGTAQDALMQFPAERPVFLREYSTNHYSVFSYFTSRFTMEALVTLAQILCLTIITYFMISFQMAFVQFFSITYVLAMASTAMAVFLGSTVEDPKLAAEMLPLLFVPQMLFAGFFVVPDLIPVWLRWAQYLCSLTYAVRLMVLEEFGPCADAGAIGCANMIDNLGASDNDTYWYWILLIVIFFVFRLAALTVLARKARKFY
jgi:hypothetical protein